MNLSEDINGKETIVNLSSNAIVNYKVIDNQNSVYTMQASYGKISFRVEVQNKGQEFSSESNDASDALSKFLKEMTNKPFFVKMSSLGRITEVKNIDSLFINMLNKFPEIAEEKKQQLITQLSQSYGEKSVASNLQMCTAVFPETPVKKGDTWLIKSIMESSMSLNMETTFQLTETGHNYNVLTGNANVKNVGNDTYVKIGSSFIKYNLTGTATSNIKMDKKTGWVMDGKLTMNIAGTAHIKGDDEHPEGLDVPMTIVSETAITK